MKHPLISHYFKTNLDEIVNRSLLNCHCIGLHSIMLAESPGRTIRLYITSADHELWRNSNGHAQSIAFHPHHCDLTLHCIYGALVNVSTGPGSGMTLNKYIYKSKINTDEMAFEYIGVETLENPKIDMLGVGNHLFLKAKDIHTVFCSKGTVNAWLVYEGKDDPDYIPYCWTNKDLTQVTGEDLYIKPSRDIVEALLKSIHAI